MCWTLFFVRITAKVTILFSLLSFSELNEHNFKALSQSVYLLNRIIIKKLLVLLLVCCFICVREECKVTLQYFRIDLIKSLYIRSKSFLYTINFNLGNIWTLKELWNKFVWYWYLSRHLDQFTRQVVLILICKKMS